MKKSKLFLLSGLAMLTMAFAMSCSNPAGGDSTPAVKPQPKPIVLDEDNSVVLDLSKYGTTFRSGATYVSVEIDGKKVITTKDRFKFEGDGDLKQVITSFIANNVWESNANKYQWGYVAMPVDGNPYAVRIMPISEGKKITSNECYLVGVGGFEGKSKNYDLIKLTPLVLDLSKYGTTFRSGATYVSVVINGEKVITTKDRFKFEGDGDLKQVVASFIANNRWENGANQHQWGYVAMPVEGNPYAVSITPTSADKKITSNECYLVGVGGFEGKSKNYDLSYWPSVYVDLSEFGTTFRSGATYVSVEIDGKKVITTKDCFKFNGDGDFKQVVESFVANNKGLEGANQHQWGYVASKVPGMPYVVRITPTSADKKITSNECYLVGVGGFEGKSKNYTVSKYPSVK